MGDLEKQERAVLGKEEAAEEEKERLVGGNGMAVLDFDMLCSTVALQTQGKLQSFQGGEEGEVGDLGGVFRMWEGELLDCFDDRRIALESAWFVLSASLSFLVCRCFLAGIFLFFFPGKFLFWVQKGNSFFFFKIPAQNSNNWACVILFLIVRISISVIGI